MKKQQRNFMPKQRVLLASLALAVIAAVGMPVSASANSTAKTTIMNKVTVTYKDASLANTFTADATTIVTVNLVKAALSPTGAPTGADGNPGLACLPAIDTVSGGTISAIYALTATANGMADYKLSIANTPHNLTGVTVVYNTLTYTGANDGLLPANPSPATRTLGSAIPTRVVDNSTLEFPGGALEGFAINDIVIVQTAAGKKAFLVTAVDPGTAPVYSHVGNSPYTDTGAYTTPNKQGTLTLGAYANQTITLNTTNDTTFGGGGTAPAFTVPATAATLGVPVGEMILVKVSVTATTNTALDGTVDYTLTTTDSLSGNPSTITCTAGTFKAPTLSIMKEVRNFSTSGAFGATANGNPGQILEYRVTVTNSGGQAAQVVVADAVPSYTTLVANATYGSGTAGNIFAKITDNAATPLSVQLTTAVDSETQPNLLAQTGYGDAPLATALSPIKFFLGNAATNAAGGKLPYCSNGTSTTLAACTAASKDWITTLTILYQVKID